MTGGSKLKRILIFLQIRYNLRSLSTLKGAPKTRAAANDSTAAKTAAPGLPASTWDPGETARRGTCDPPVCGIVIRVFSNHQQSTGPDSRPLRCAEDRIARSTVGKLGDRKCPAFRSAERGTHMPDCAARAESLRRDPLVTSQGSAI